MNTNLQTDTASPKRLSPALLKGLLAQAQDSPRLRMAMDLRNSPQDQSQRMLNALIPGTQVPVHRHPTSSESVVVLYGKVTHVFFDEEGHETEHIWLDAQGPLRALDIPRGLWHTVIVTEPCVLMEAKDGAYAPVRPEDIMEV